ncbi:MAG: hypothetical protein HKN43_11940 [Rhodothermales bacterium]|nr:hypothetical protein [Rhodothermales bacterium]
MKTGLMIAILCLGLNISATAQEADQYKQAYDMVLAENWAGAERAFDSFLARYPDGKWSDDAQYWQCHVQEKRGSDLEDVFDCYQDFVGEYKGSSWADDAESSMVRVGNRLVNSGKREYAAIIEQIGESAEEEVRLVALDALWQMGDERALDVALELYDDNASVAFKKKLIFAFSQFDSPRATAKLKEIAKADDDPEIRKDAIFWIAERRDSESIDFLTSLTTGNEPVEVQKQVAFAFSQLGDAGVTALIKLARNSRHEEVRKDAIFWLGQTGGPEVASFFDELLATSKDPEVMEQVIFAFSQMGGEESLNRLARIAQSHENDELRKEAIFWISQTGGSRAASLMESIEKSNPSEEVMESVVFAYSQMGEEGLKRLGALASTHPSAEVRKESIFWLGQSGGSQATEVFDDILETSDNKELIEQVVFALSQLPDDQGVDQLIDLAKNHPNADVRKSAVFYLGQNDSDRARQALVEIIRGRD